MIENGVLRIAAALTRARRSIVNLPSSIFDFLASPVAFPADHVDHTESRNDIRHHVTFDHLVKGAHSDKTGRAHSDAVRFTAAVADNIETQFAVAPFHGRIGFTRWHMDSLHNDFEMIHQPFDAVINFFLFRQHETGIVDPNRPHGKLLQRLLHDSHALLDLLDTADEAIVIVPSAPQRNIEIELIINQIRIGFADVIVHAGGAQDGTRKTVRNSRFLGDRTDVRHSIDENPVAREQTIAVVQQLADDREGPAHLLRKVMKQIMFDAADADIGDGQARTGEVFNYPREKLPGFDHIKCGSNGAQLRSCHAAAGEMIKDARQFAYDDTDVLTARRSFDADQFFHGQGIADVVDQ